jgi:DNA polymerase elongation subunit (family B)
MFFFFFFFTNIRVISEIRGSRYFFVGYSYAAPCSPWFKKFFILGKAGKSADKKMFRGWLFDIYSGECGMTLWLIGTDDRRIRLEAPYSPSFFVAGSKHVIENVKSLFRQTKEQPSSHAPRATENIIRNTQHATRNTRHAPVSFSMTEQRDFWTGCAIPVLRVTTSVRSFNSTVKQVAKVSGAELYNCDIPPEQMYLYETGLFPLALCEVKVAENGTTVASVRACDSPWDIDYSLPPLEVFKLSVSGNSANPNYGGKTRGLKVEVDGTEYLLEESELLDTLEDMLKRYDPDLILTEWGDSFIIPRLTLMAERQGHPLSLNRESNRSTATRRGASYFSYGRIIYRAPARTLFGRWHIDLENSFIASETGLDGLFELARLTKIPVQRLARTSPGTGISSMQIDKAIQDGVLIPWRKRMPEDFKTGIELLVSDKGGLVYLPKPGVYEKVMEIDFASMYPAIMVNHNISPETINCSCCEDEFHEGNLSSNSVGANLFARAGRKQDENNMRINSHLQGPDPNTQLQDNLGNEPHEDKPAGEPPVGEPVPEIGHRVCRKRRGLVPRALAPILEKRRIYKEIAGKSEEELLRQALEKAKGERSKAKGKDKEIDKKGIESVQQFRRGGPDDSVGATRRVAPTKNCRMDSEKELLEQIRDMKASCKKRQNALKWMLVTCFGYLGYKNARFGRIEAHEAVTALGREKLLQAKEIAERRGFELVHAIVDSLWLRKQDMPADDQQNITACYSEQPTPLTEGNSPFSPFIKGGKGNSIKGEKEVPNEELQTCKQDITPDDQQGIPARYSESFGRAQDKLREESQAHKQDITHDEQQGLLHEISEAVGIPIALEGNYRWIAFVPSRTAPTVAVANRYFGLFDNGEMKMRGIEVRRSDVPLIVRKMQTEMLRVLASTSTAAEFEQKTPEALEILKSYLARVRRGEVHVEELVISQKLSKNASEYKTNTAMAAAAGTLLASGIKPQPGERVELILVDSKAHGQATKAIPYTASVETVDAYDIEKYSELLIRAAETVLLRRLSKRELAEELL